MRNIILASILSIVALLGSHGAYLEITHEDSPLVLVGGTGGGGLEYRVDAEDVFFRVGASLGSDGFYPSVSLGYPIPDSTVDLRVGVFQGDPYIGVGVGF